MININQNIDCTDRCGHHQPAADPDGWTGFQLVKIARGTGGEGGERGEFRLRGGALSIGWGRGLGLALYYLCDVKIVVIFG